MEMDTRREEQGMRNKRKGEGKRERCACVDVYQKECHIYFLKRSVVNVLLSNLGSGLI